MFRIYPNDLTSHGNHYFRLLSGREQPMAVEVKQNGQERTFAVNEGFVIGDGGVRLSAIHPTEHSSSFTIESPDRLITEFAQAKPTPVTA